MDGKSDIYIYQRLNRRNTGRNFVLPSFPKLALKKSLKGMVSWETGFLVILAFFCGRAVLTGGLVPFSAALLASVLVSLPDKGFWVMAASLGGMATVTSGHSFAAAVIYMVLLFLILGQARAQFRRTWFGIPLLVAGLIIAARVGTFAYFDPSLYNYILAIFESVLSGCASFLIIRAMPVLRKRGSLVALKKEEIIGGAVLVIAFLMGLSEFRLYGTELRNIVGRTLVIFAAYSGGSGFGAAMGTIVGMVPGINTITTPGMVVVYSFSGMVAGMFRGVGRVGICIGFILGNVLLSIYLTDYNRLVTTFTETGLSVLIFMLIPPKRLFAARAIVKNSFFNSSNKPVNETRIREITASKVREYSRIFKELSKSFQEVSCDTRMYEENNLQNLFNGITGKVCKGCSLYRVCWEKEFYKTYRNVMDMLAHIDVSGRLTEEHVPQDILKRCSRLRELTVTVNCLFENYKQSQVWQRKLTEGRDIVGGQLEGIAEIMQNLATELKIDIRMREDIEVILRSELVRAGYNINGLNVVGEGTEQLEVSISCPSCGGKMQCVNEIGPLVSGVLSQPLTVLNSNYCTKKTGEPICEFRLRPKRALEVELGFASAAKDASLISGDTYSTFDLKDGKFAIALSDGMGVGPKAAAESKAAITLLEKLLETGFEKNMAVKTVNSILVLGSPDET
ncbi:MAG TPA: hypothetical protein VNT57_04965, partial [Desulfobacteria bacterium]|nr:hypothetical protein [Desulfobacteria bacterium]